MSTRGMAVVVKRLPRLCSLLRPSYTTPAPPRLLDSQAVEMIATLPRTFSSPLHGYCQQVVGIAMRSKHHHFSTSAAPQGESSEKSPPTAVEADVKIISVRQIMADFAKAPMVPMFLGVAGAVPFLALTPPFPYWLPLPEVLASNPIEAQALYGAVILSFLGGPHWGLAMVGIQASPSHRIFNYAANSARYVWSVVPTLLAWPALLMTTVPKLQVLICSFGLVLAVDVLFASHALTPPWYLPVRLLLSAIVILCLSTSLLEVLLTKKLEALKKTDGGN